MDIGTRIAYLRRQANLTQTKLADMLHVSPKTVSKWENGYGLPDIKIVPDLAAALGVDADFLLTGRSKPALDPYERAEPAETKPSSLSSPWSPPPKGVFRLRLWQTTHSNLSGWVLFFAILMLILALIGAPVEFLNDEGTDYLPFAVTIFVFYRPNVTAADSTAAWGIAIGLVWIIVFLVFEALSIVGIASAMNGREDYLDRFAAIQLIGLTAVAVLTFIGSMIVNIYGGEVYMRPSPLFVVLIVCACLQWIICRLALMNNMKIGRFKAVSALVLAVTMAASITFAILPNTIVPTAFAADAVQISEWNIQLRQNDQDMYGEDIEIYEGYSMLVVRSNIKLENMYENDASCRYTDASGREAKYSLITATKYCSTEYKGGLYYNFFSIDLRFSVPSGSEYSDFEFSFYFPEDSEQTIFTVRCDAAEMLPSIRGEFACSDWARPTHGGGSVEMGDTFDLTFGVSFSEEVTIRGYTTNLPDAQIYYSLGEYAPVYGDVYELSGYSDEQLLGEQANIAIPVYKVKEYEGYGSERQTEIRWHVKTIPPLQRYGAVYIDTDHGTIPLLQEWKSELIVESYMESF